MNVKIENQSPNGIKNLDRQVERVLDLVPGEHLRGFSKIVLVDAITEPRISALQRATLPALYHPRMGGQMAWGEIATSVLMPKKKLSERLMSRMALKPNLAQLVLSLIAQHYHIAVGEGVKKAHLVSACRMYTGKYFEKWRESNGGLRMKLTKPFRPTLDKWAKKLSKKYNEGMAKEKKRSD